MFKPLATILICVAVLGCDSRRAACQPPPRSESPRGSARTSAVPQRWALLVGLENYAYLPSLESACRRVEHLKQTLIAGGFPQDQVIALHDDLSTTRYRPYRANIQREWNMASRCAAAEDLVVFAVLGRGVQVDRQPCLCPLESPVNSTRDAIPISALIDKAAACSSRQKILILELFDAALPAASPPADDSLGLRAMPMPPGLTAIVRWHTTSGVEETLLEQVSDALAGEADFRRDGSKADGDGFVSREELIERIQAPRAGGPPATALVWQQPGVEDYRIGRISKVGQAAAELAKQSLHRAHALCAQGKLDEAFAEYTQSIQLDPFQTAAYRYRGSLSWSKKNFQQAVDDFRRIGKTLTLILPCSTAELRVDERITANLRQGQQLEVTGYREGHLWVSSVDGDPGAHGWIPERAFQ